MESPLTRFSATVRDYGQHRPGYPAALVDWILSAARVAPPALVLDVGCGTGISSRLFAARGLDVVGIDPNPDMLAAARSEGGEAGRPRFVRSTVEQSGLRDGSFDLAVGGQAFHWFDTARALGELARVLKPGGSCAAFWNERVEDGVTGEYDALMERHSSEYRELLRRFPRAEAFRDQVASLGVREASFPNEQRLDREGLIGRARSASYVVHGVADLAAFERELAAVFERHECGGEVRFQYRTLAFLWQASAFRR